MWSLTDFVCLWVFSFKRLKSYNVPILHAMLGILVFEENAFCFCKCFVALCVRELQQSILMKHCGCHRVCHLSHLITHCFVVFVVYFRLHTRNISSKKNEDGI